MADIWIDGVDVATYGFQGTGLDGTLSSIPFDWDMAEIPNRSGAFVSGAIRKRTQPFTLRGLIQGTTMADSRTKLRNLHDLCGNGEIVTVRIADQTDVRRNARLRRSNVTPFKPDIVTPWLLVDLSFESVDDPYWEDETPQTVVVGVGATNIPTGNADGGAVYTITAATNPVITHKDSAGVTLATSTLTQTVAGADNIIIDTMDMTIKKTISGVVTSVPAILTAGEFPRRLLAKHAVYRSSQWQTLAISSGSMSVDYRRKYQ